MKEETRQIIEKIEGFGFCQEWRPKAKNLIILAKPKEQWYIFINSETTMEEADDVLKTILHKNKTFIISANSAHSNIFDLTRKVVYKI